MPFKSKAQKGYLFAAKPNIAREFAQNTTKSSYKSLPERLGKRDMKKSMKGKSY